MSGQPPSEGEATCFDLTQGFAMKGIVYKKAVARFQGKIHMVHDPIAISHGDDLLELHTWVERSIMGCPACLELNS